jgi:hypothetical protein
VNESRIVHITLEKCGSQWVRDALTAPEIVRQSGFAYSGVKFNLGTRSRLDLPANKVSGPIYNMNQWEWAHWRSAGDRAIVVLRDPRDIVISLLFSLLYSHGPDAGTEFNRDQLATRAHDEALTDRMIEAFGAAPRMFFTWTDVDDASALVIKYEELIADQIAGFRKIYDWLGWHIPDGVLNAVVHRLDFQARSGRKPGTLDVFSHYRRGVAGDWRNYFTRKHGRHWEAAYPGLLRGTRYEFSDDWWHSLPESASGALGGEGAADFEADARARTIVSLRRRNAFLEKEVEEKERVIRELDAECAQRLDTVQSLNAELVQITNECDARFETIRALDAERVQLLSVCDERLRAIETLTQALSAQSALNLE